MDSSLVNLTDEINEALKRLGATHYSKAFNNDYPSNRTPSSVHFFSGDEFADSKGLPEVACFTPGMHGGELGRLSGFTENSRSNPIDVQGLKPIPSEFFRDI